MFPLAGSRVGRSARTLGPWPMTIVQRSSSQTISSSVQTAITWDAAVVHDDVGGYDPTAPTRITVPAPFTLARVSGFIIWASSSSQHRWIIPQMSGGELMRMNKPGSNETGETWISRWLRVKAGDYFTTEVFQNSGGNLGVQRTSPGLHPYMMVEFAGAPMRAL